MAEDVAEVIAHRPRAGGLRVLVRGYQMVSQLTPARCRFYPTCSQYAYEALSSHGAWRGSWLAAQRIAHCHPFHPGGVDHVPPPREHSSKERIT